MAFWSTWRTWAIVRMTRSRRVRAVGSQNNSNAEEDFLNNSNQLSYYTILVFQITVVCNDV